MLKHVFHTIYNSLAVLYYTSQYFIWWDFGGMTIQDRNTGGIHPNCCRPKPRSSTPRNFLILFIFSTKNKCSFTSKIYVLGFCWDDHSRPQMCWDRSQQLPSQSPTNHLFPYQKQKLVVTLKIGKNINIIIKVKVWWDEHSS